MTFKLVLFAALGCRSTREAKSSADLSAKRVGDKPPFQTRSLRQTCFQMVNNGK